MFISAGHLFPFHLIRQLDFHFLGADKVAGKQVSRDCVGAGKTKSKKSLNPQYSVVSGYSSFLP